MNFNGKSMSANIRVNLADTVVYTPQDLNEAEQEQARKNIGAASVADNESVSADLYKSAKIRTQKLDVQTRIGGVNNNGNFNANDKTCVIVARPIKLLAGSTISVPAGYSLFVAEYNAPKYGTAYKVNVTKLIESFTVTNDNYYAFGITDGSEQTDTSLFEEVSFDGYLESAASAIESDRTNTDAFRSKYLDSYPNMVDYRTRTTKKTIDSKGVVTDSTSYAISDFVLVKPNTNYVTKAVVYIAQYDADKNFIVRIDVSNGVFWTTSSDTCYVRIVSNLDPKNWQLNEGKELAADAVYGAKLKNMDIAHLLVAEDVEKLLVKRGLRFYPVPAGLNYNPAPVSGDNYNLFRQFGDTLAVEDKDTEEIELDTAKTKGALEKLYKAFTDLRDDSNGYLSIRLIGTSAYGASPTQDGTNEFPAEPLGDGVYNIIEISTNVADYVSSTEKRDNNGEIEKDDKGNTVWEEVYKKDNIPTIILLAGIHGFEKASIYSTYYFLRDLVTRWREDPVLEYLRWHCNFKIVPVANPHGYVHNSYVNGYGVNLNRAFDWYHAGITTGTYAGGTLVEEEGKDYKINTQCPEANAIAELICENSNAAILIDFHTTGMEFKHNMVMYHNLLAGNYLAPMKQAALDHINYVHRRYWDDYDFSDTALTGFQYLQTTDPAGQSYGFCQSKGVYGQLVEVGCNLPGEDTLYSPKCMEANTRTIGQWLYMAIKAIADINEHQAK